MKREIIFRGLWLGSEWKYGSLIQDGETCTIFTIDREEYEVDPKSVGQYIGFCDIKTVAIYEGDILHDHFDNIFEVVFTDVGNFGLKSTNPENSDYEYELLDHTFISLLLRVIGNIYENPEQLKFQL